MFLTDGYENNRNFKNICLTGPMCMCIGSKADLGEENVLFAMCSKGQLIF